VKTFNKLSWTSCFFDIDATGGGLVLQNPTTNGEEFNLAGKEIRGLNWTVRSSNPGSYLLRVKADSNFGYAQFSHGITGVTFAGGKLQPEIILPATDNTSYGTGTFDVNARVTCVDANCGATSLLLQFCQTANCTNFSDMNSVSGGLQLANSSTNPLSMGDLNINDVKTGSWSVNATVSDFYELKLVVSAPKVDSNSTSGTDRTINIVGDSVGLTVAYPSTGCTEGKGCLTGSCTACTRCYFDANTGTTGSSGFDANQVACEGQNSATPFLTFTNTGNIDISIDINFTVALDTNYRLKVSEDPNGYQGQCSDTLPLIGSCLLVTDTTAKTVISGLGPDKDGNVWAWADFVRAGAVGEYNATLLSTPIET
jgi:hypothetical protein